MGEGQGDSAKAYSHPETSPKDTFLLPNSWARGTNWEAEEQLSTGTGQKLSCHATCELLGFADELRKGKS